MNQLRTRAATSTQMIASYPNLYGVKMYITNYRGSYSKDETMKIVKMERRLELGMESERFFDLVRWGDAATVLNKYYAEEIHSSPPAPPTTSATSSSRATAVSRPSHSTTTKATSTFLREPSPCVCPKSMRHRPCN